MKRNILPILTVVLIVIAAAIVCVWSGGGFGGTLPSTTSLDRLESETTNQQINMQVPHVFKVGEDLFAVYLDKAFTPAGAETYTFYWSKKLNGQWTDWKKVEIVQYEVFSLPAEERIMNPPTSFPPPGQVWVQGISGEWSDSCSHIVVCRPKLVIRIEGGE